MPLGVGPRDWELGLGRESLEAAGPMQLVAAMVPVVGHTPELVPKCPHLVPGSRTNRYRKVDGMKTRWMDRHFSINKALLCLSCSVSLGLAFPHFTYAQTEAQRGLFKVNASIAWGHHTTVKHSDIHRPSAQDQSPVCFSRDSSPVQWDRCHFPCFTRKLGKWPKASHAASESPGFTGNTVST